MPAGNNQDRVEFAQAIMHLLDEWGLGGAQIVQLLSLPAKTRIRHLERFRVDTPLPDDGHVMERAEQIVGIADALRTTYPRNGHMAVIWLQKPHRRFQNRTPLDTMVDDGLAGLMRVRAELDCSYAWDRTGSQ